MVRANDQMAVGAMEELTAPGLRLPDDCVVTGFDGLRIGRMVRRALTTVHRPMPKMGRRAVDLLVDRLDGAQRDPVSRIPDRRPRRGAR